MLHAAALHMLCILFLTSQFSVTLSQKSDAFPKCSNNSHVEGRWARKTKNEFRIGKSFFCCGIPMYLDHPSECGVDNQDVNFYGKDHQTLAGKNHSLAFSSNQCACENPNNLHGISDVEKYKWVPKHCALTEWDATQFCDLLGNRTILFVGDSTMFQFSLSLMSMIATDTNRTSHYAKNCSPQLRFARSWYLTFKYNSNTEHEYATMEEYAVLFKPDILMMNVGAHLHDLGDLNFIWEGLIPAFASLRAKLPNIKLVWKTQAPGHVQCESHRGNGPIEEFSPGDPALDKYQWNIHKEFDAISRNFSAAHGLALFDVSPTYLRPDAHPAGDCLHFCVPGPLNLGANILLQMLINKEI